MRMGELGNCNDAMYCYDWVVWFGIIGVFCPDNALESFQVMGGVMGLPRTQFMLFMEQHSSCVFSWQGRVCICISLELSRKEKATELVWID